ncbi:hypothetical protein AVEN_238843-1 [Araneus ventricosus]|uniref:DDE-1 domain-containing protein n=1 Tax=Araneus ventricosus TaxID=182803 RepID=A0A4Y2EMK4_ARAVE|nr:hypothetical protein AVEN_238843-1 [Araneus ventricosus]
MILFNTIDPRLTGIGLSGLRIRKRRFRPLECAGRSHSSQPFYCIGFVQPTLSPARLQLDCSENVDEEALGQWINEDSTLEWCEVLSDDDIVPPETRNFEECPESDEENLVTQQKLSQGDTLVHIEALLNYLEQEDESTPAEKMILKTMHSINSSKSKWKTKIDFYHFILHKTVR